MSTPVADQSLEDRVAALEAAMRRSGSSVPWLGIVRAVAYLRVSKGSQTEDMQLEAIQNFAENHGWDLVTVYRDIGVSGATADRAGLKKMMAAARKGGFDAIIVWKADRLFRSLRSLVNTIDALKKLEIAFVSVTEPFDYATPEGKLIIQLCGAFAEFERNLQRTRTKAGMAAARARGVHIGRPPRNLDRFEVLKFIKAGYSYRKIAKTLACGDTTLARSIKSWKEADRKRGLDPAKIWGRSG